MEWTGHVARVGVMRNTCTKFEDLKGSNDYGDLGVAGCLKLKLFLKK